MPTPDMFPPAFAPGMLPSGYPFPEPIKYPEYTLLPKTNAPSTPPRSPSDSGSESEEVRSAFVPIRLNTLNQSPVVPASVPVVPKKPTEGVRNELKAPKTLISQRSTKSPSPTKISSPAPTKPVWRPY